MWKNRRISYLSIPLGYRMWDKENSKLKLAAEMVELVMPVLADKHVVLLFDSWYAKKAVTKLVDGYDNLDIVCNTRVDSVMYDLAPAKTGKRGRPAKHGKKLWMGNGVLFTQWDGKQMNPSTPYHKFQEIIDWYNSTVTDDEKKLPHIPLHGLRHTSATLLIAENVDVRTVSARLGHSQSSTTMNIYAHALREKDGEAADALAGVLANKTQ